MKPEEYKKAVDYYFTLYKHALDIACMELAELKNIDFNIVRDDFLKRATDGEMI